MLTSEAAMTDLYSQEDVQEILQLAIARQTDAGELTRAQLLEIADELGISPMDLQLAEQEWLTRQGENRERQTFNLYRQQRLKQRLTRFLIVNAFLVVLNLLTAGGLTWSLYVLLGWGVFTALSVWKLRQMDGDDYEDAFQKWRRRRLIKKSINTFFDRWLR
ncbi:2TM domain-containing protein [Oscillatoria sp. FACHB-1407]|uniref:2TM domain-containing protein n=1 Tax=Oscillatoria sp. FACHB-1407 TaxID=2692847 RepID=UPI0016839288|nr:2TM domain-containing protein [Oscillatoria sp. FACHB-1407]MBD2464981.1 2TM domain-containing protein [Oscillatoria sp. FACHB-1407]